MDPIKEKVRVNNTVPDVVEQVIKETCNHIRMEEKRVHKLKSRKVISIGLVTIAILLFSTITFAAVIGKLDDLLKQMYPTATKNYELAKIDIGTKEEMAEKEMLFTAEPVTADGITITINEVAYDGVALIYKYRITTERTDFPFASDVGKAYVYDIIVGDRKINDWSEMDSEGKYVEKNTYEGYGRITFNMEEDEILNQKELISFRIGEVCGINGEWLVQTNASLEDIYNLPTVYKVDEKAIVEGLEVNREKVIVSLFSMQVNYKIKDSELIDEFHEPIRFFVIDDKGNCLNYRTRGVIRAQNELTAEDGSIQAAEGTLYDIENTIELIPVNEELNELTFIPYRNYSYKNQGLDTFDIKQREGQLSINENLKIGLSNIQIKSGAITFEYIFKGLNPEWRYLPFNFLDEDGNDITNEEGLNIVLDSEDGKSYVTYTTQYPEEVATIAVGQYFDCEVLQEQAFKVKLK